MTNSKIEQTIAHALRKTAPNDVNDILSHCKEQEASPIPASGKRRKPGWLRFAAACLALLLLSSGGLLYRNVNAAVSVISLDVNPSIELTVNRRNQILTCTPLNNEAKAVLADMGGGDDLKNTKLEVAINAIVGSLVRNGYLSSISSAIMISVEDSDQRRAEKLQSELAYTVDSILQSSASGAAVLTQTVPQSSELEKLAQENQISTGKAALVDRILAINSSLQFDELAKLSVDELKDLAESGAPAMPIGTAQALAFAISDYIAHHGKEPAFTDADAELDETPAHYEVELTDANGNEVTYQIDAYTGNILACKTDAADNSDLPSTRPVAPDSSQIIDRTQAKNIVLEHAGIREDRIFNLEIELDDENGCPIYEIEFEADNAEYEYTIDALTGLILAYEAES